ncbi:hypothetical protein QRN89_29610 [Streptomyces chengbuensis]|uniref:hypothetical protein n=1 Tax=Streptomyces chengbuensis TaxID=3053466 RepID=UPI0025B5F40F|nr:hypothetical protein [Streptomyces sp. HUAS CB01]WJY55082.1 hypothetical protein QRN89_29610 [Streptomyces sp. HUAS CB01]
MTFIPLTRCASLAASARTHNRPHPIACVQPETVELAHQLMYLPVGERRAQVAAMAPGTLMDVMIALDRHAGSAYELWRDTPAGFAEDILGLILDDEQRAVLDAAAADETRRIAARGPHPDNHVMAAALMAWAALVSGPRGWDYLPRVAVSFAQYRQTSASVWRVLARFIDTPPCPAGSTWPGVPGGPTASRARSASWRSACPGRRRSSPA